MKNQKVPADGYGNIFLNGENERLENEDGELYNKELSRQGDEIFEEESAFFKIKNVEDYIDLYPDHFREALKKLNEEEDLPFFYLDENNPSPLIWLLLNDPYTFSLTCWKYADVYEEMKKSILNNRFEILGEKARNEMKHVREELESYLLKLNFGPFQSKLIDNINYLYSQAELIEDDEEKEIYVRENIDVLALRYEWIFNKERLDQLNTRINNFHKKLVSLDNIIQEKGLYDKEETTVLLDKEGKETVRF